MPPFRVAAAALRKTTEQIGTWLEKPPESPPSWSELEWAIARASAAMQGVSGLLARRLPWSGPPEWRFFLDEQHQRAVLREEKIDGLREKIDEATKRAEISCVGLKGAALRKLNLYGPGERPTGDIDLLVRAADLDSVDEVLTGLGYVKLATLDRHVIYGHRSGLELRNFAEDPRNPVPIEVHTTVSELLPVSKVDITSVLTSTLTNPGMNAYPNLSALMLHLLLHAAGNIKANALRHIQLHDIAILSRRLSNNDWQDVLAGTPGSNPWWLFPPLALTERYFPGSIPPNVLAQARAACPLVLRLAADRYTLTDVSWSNLRIAAFPGIAFSRSPLEALRLVRSRLLPRRAELAALEDGLKRKPHLYRVPWYGLPHGARILRWVFSRPPRVQTMISLRASLDNPGMSVD